MAQCVPAPACVAVRRQASRLWPDRSQASDGICASPKHTAASPNSDHEPHVVINGTAYATAVDLTHDPANGCDAHGWLEHLRQRRDPRLKYGISNGRMFASYATSKRRAWEWGPYTGANSHSKHAHLSILPSAVFDDGPWFPELDPSGGDDELTSDERDAILTANHFVKVVWPQYAAKIDEIHQHLEVLMKGATLGNGAVIPPVPKVVFEIAEKHGIDV